MQVYPIYKKPQKPQAEAVPDGICPLHKERKVLICVKKGCESEDRVICNKCKNLFHTNHKVKILHSKVQKKLDTQGSREEKQSDASRASLCAAEPSDSADRREQGLQRPFQQQCTLSYTVGDSMQVRKLIKLSLRSIAILGDKSNQLQVWDTRLNRCTYRFTLRKLQD